MARCHCAPIGAARTPVVEWGLAPIRAPSPADGATQARATCTVRQGGKRRLNVRPRSCQRLKRLRCGAASCERVRLELCHDIVANGCITIALRSALADATDVTDVLVAWASLKGQRTSQPRTQAARRRLGGDGATAAAPREELLQCREDTWQQEMAGVRWPEWRAHQLGLLHQLLGGPSACDACAPILHSVARLSRATRRTHVSARVGQK